VKGKGIQREDMKSLVLHSVWICFRKCHSPEARLSTTSDHYVCKYGCKELLCNWLHQWFFKAL